MDFATRCILAAGGWSGRANRRGFDQELVAHQLFKTPGLAAQFGHINGSTVGRDTQPR
jgi:hypothetical protein